VVEAAAKFSFYKSLQVIKLTKKENKPVMEGNYNIGPFSCCASIKPHKEGFKEAICEVCDRVFKTDKDVYICPDCQEKTKK